MNLRESLLMLSENYLSEKKKSFSGNPLADHLRATIPSIVQAEIGENDRYYIKGSAGQSRWANVPWVAVLDRTVTTTPKQGFYLVYLLKEDGDGIYLSLNQGVTNFKEKYGNNVSKALEIKSSDFQQQLKFTASNVVSGPIDLGSSQKGSLGMLYQHGAIYSVFYEAKEIPSNDVLVEDLNIFMDLYIRLTLNQSLAESVNIEEDEADLSVEDASKLREHKRVERNQTLAKKVKKKQGYKCKACGFDFEERYGEIGKHFIEAHHLTPMSKLKGKKVGLDPTKDFSVLCSNCHRMIHKTEFVDKVEEFRAQYLVH